MAGRATARSLVPAAALLLALGGGCGRGEDVAPPPGPAFTGAAPETTAGAPGEASPSPGAVDPSAPAGSRAGMPADPKAIPGYDTDISIEDIPRVAQRVAPQYPEAARRAGIQGVVVTRVLVLPDGTVGDVRVIQSIPELDQAAIDCVRQWRFGPSKAPDGPLPVWVGVPIHFTLR